ncbi:MAG: isoleucine--tRNA ligase [Sulfolobales archaeon]
MASLKVKDVEEYVRKFWIRNNVPSKWREWRDNAPTFTFLEGPPTANGYPHVGHIRGRTYKDFVLRYYRIKGYNVWAQGGWDEQGLPVEVEVEKKLGLKNKKDVELLGFERFVDECNKLVDHYLKVWSDVGTFRLGLWLDLTNAYETRKAYYIEHVWHFIKKMYEKGLLFEGFRVLPYCPRCETALSDAEVDQGYEEKVSPSIYVKFKLTNHEKTYLLIWTTTPWTLIDNEAVAVRSDGDYCKALIGDEYVFIAKDLITNISKLLGVEVVCVEELKGDALSGLKYEHPLITEVPIHREHIDSHKVLTADFVSLTEGSGLVHIAPAHGPEDYELGVKHNLPISNSVNINGVFNEFGGVFKNLSIEEASRKVIEILKSKGLLVYEGTITHMYPHCWRCGTPLIYRTDKQWFLKISSTKDRLIASLDMVRIYPEKLRDRFYNWLINAKDWTISRSRIWGTPLPIWRCKEDPEKILVVGSIEELTKLAVELPDVDKDKLVHRPWIDNVKLSTEDCREWVREPYVIDVWIDSGVAWMASIDGLRNLELFKKLYPYDFVTEAIDQTRGWFYSLLATSVLMNDKPPYKSILIQGHVVDKYGQKMSKSKGNVIWAQDIFEKYGVDPVRAYILTKFAPGEVFSFDPDEVKEMINKLNIIWNVYRFAHMYMSLDKFNPRTYRLDELITSARVEDIWILSKFYSTLKAYESSMKKYELHQASRAIFEYLIEYLSHRYIRLVRPRVWKEEGDDKFIAYAVLYKVLKESLKLLAPIIPHISEYLWLHFVKYYEPDEAESLHLTKLPQVDEDRIRSDLEMDFELIFELYTSVNSMRNALGIKLRWPVKEVFVELGSELLTRISKYSNIIKFLANAKDIYITAELPSKCFSEEFLTKDFNKFKVCVSKAIDKELYYEGIARELIRRIQVMRNKANLAVDEFIELAIFTDDEDVKDSIKTFYDFILSETRSTSIINEKEGMYLAEWDLEGRKVTIGIRRAKH